MRKLIETTHVSLGGAIGPSLEWAFPYLNDEHMRYATDQLLSADALLLGRKTYQGLSAAYTSMQPNAFVDRMNSMPKYVASSTLKDAAWNATVINGDVAAFVADLKQQPGKDIIKYGTGPLDDTLLAHDLIDEFHFLLTPVAVGKGTHLFEDLEATAQLTLTDVTRLANGVLILTYTPK